MNNKFIVLSKSELQSVDGGARKFSNVGKFIVKIYEKIFG